MRNSVIIVVFLFLFTNCKNRIVEEYIYNECKTLLNNKDTVGIIDLSSIKQFSWDTLYYFLQEARMMKFYRLFPLGSLRILSLTLNSIFTTNKISFTTNFGQYLPKEKLRLVQFQIQRNSLLTEQMRNLKSQLSIITPFSCTHY